MIVKTIRFLNRNQYQVFMVEYPVQLGHDKDLYRGIQKILRKNRLSKDIKDSIDDLCTGDVKGDPMLDSRIEKSLIRLISNYTDIFPGNKLKPFGKDEKYWVTNEQFIALYWECLKYYHKKTMEELFSNYLLEVKNYTKLNENDLIKLQQLKSKRPDKYRKLKKINYFELIILGRTKYSLAGSHGLVFKNATKIYRRLDDKGVLQRKGKTETDDKTYLMINPMYVYSTPPLQPRSTMQHYNNHPAQSLSTSSIPSPSL